LCCGLDPDSVSGLRYQSPMKEDSVVNCSHSSTSPPPSPHAGNHLQRSQPWWRRLQWPLGGDLFYDNVKSRAYIVLIISYYIVSLFIDTRGENSVVIFMAGVALVPLLGILLIANEHNSYRVWLLVFLAFVAFINYGVVYSAKNSQEPPSITVKFALWIRIAITLVLDAYCLLGFISHIFKIPYFFEYRARVYMESTVSKMRSYRKQAAEKTFFKRDLQIERAAPTCWSRLKGFFSRDLFVPSVLILSSFSTCFLLVFTAGSMSQFVWDIRNNLQQTMFDIKSTKMLFVSVDNFFSNFSESFDLNIVTANLETLQKTYPQFENVTAALELAGLKAEADIAKKIDLELVEAVSTLVNQMKVLQDALNLLTENSSSIPTSPQSFGPKALNESDEFFVSGWIKEGYDKLVTNTIDVLDSIANFLDSVISHITVPFSLSMCISTVLSLYATAWAPFAYRSLITKLRHGEPIKLGTSDSRSKELISLFELPKSALLFGVQFSSAFIGFVLVFFCSFTIFFLLLLPEFWDFLGMNAVATFLISFAVVFLLKLLILDYWGRSLISGDGTIVKNFRAWRWYYLTSVVLGFITGVLSALTRFGLILLIGLMSLFRLDITLFPDALLGLDTCYVSFRSFVFANHRHDNPFMASALTLLAEKEPNPPSRPKRRWQLAYLLTIDPSLKAFRRPVVASDSEKVQENSID